MTEEELIVSSQKGNVGAFNQLVAIHERQVFNLAFRLLDDGDAAADAAQDTFLSAYRAIGKFRGGSFKSWLLRIAANCCYDQLRSHRRHPSVSLEAETCDDFSPASILPDPGESPETFVLRKELGREIQRGLQSLPVDQRIAIILSDIQGLSYQEIAEVTAASLGTVKSRLSRARLRMKEYLTAAGTFPAASPS